MFLFVSVMSGMSGIFSGRGAAHAMPFIFVCTVSQLKAAVHLQPPQPPQAVYMIKGSLVRKLAIYGQLSWLAFPPSSQPSSCQPHHHVNHPSSRQLECVATRECLNSRVKTLLGAKPCIFSNVAPGVAEVGSLFPRVQASICKSCRQKVHRTL